MLHGAAKPPVLTLKKRDSPDPSLSTRLARRSRQLAKRIALGVLDGVAKAAGGFAFGFFLWWIQNR
ncbi:hypothetical protein [Streptomyces sp. NPDC002215]|uniref:hypothetical protein n=1 Tax=Streptomyces sp. NPDC002215 TaxID=3154412 RepID=UPI00332F89E1